MTEARHPREGGDLRRVVILGNTGFIGARLEAVFHDRSPHLDVQGRSTASVNLTRPDEVASLADLFDLETAVVMCAAITRHVSDSLEAFWRNVSMVSNLCALLRERAVARFVFLSSAAVYGEDVHNTSITEQTPVHPTSYYGIAKYSSECLLRKAVEGGPRGSLLILRPPLIYGPGDRGAPYGPSGFVKAALRGEPIVLWGDGHERREFIFIDDLVGLTHRLTFDDYAGVLNVVSGQSYSFVDVLAAIARLVPLDVAVTARPRTKRKVDHGFCNAALTAEVPDLVFTNLSEGIRRTIEHATTEPVSAANAGGERVR